MLVFYVENLTHPRAHSAAYPGTRVDIATGTAIDACRAYAQDPANGVSAGDVLRAVEGLQCTFSTVQAQPPVTVTTGPVPTVPPVGG